MFGLGQIGRLGALASSVARAWSPLSLWPNGIASPGMWSSPRTLTSEWQDYTGTTPVATPGTVADSSNPVGLALDIRAGATVLTDPGNHMLQSTSAARPLMSARRNQLTYTEDFSNAVWQLLLDLETTPNYALAPDGSMTACRLYATGGDGTLYGHGVFTTDVVRSVWAKSNTGDSYSVTWGSGGTGVVTPTWQRIGGPASGFLYLWHLVIDEAGGDISIWHPQVELGTTATPYQSIPGNGSTYATDFPIFQKYDGVDDGMATAAFSAGTLTSAMDCMIAVRRDSAALVIAGLYETAGSGTRYTGYAESGASGLCFAGAGAPTVWVDDVQLSGGTSVTAGTLHTALTVGDWHILEFRNLDLSAWTAAAFGRYTGGIFNGPRGDIFLYPSTSSTADKDAARQYLADYYGVTLP